MFPFASDRAAVWSNLHPFPYILHCASEPGTWMPGLGRWITSRHFTYSWSCEPCKDSQTAVTSSRRRSEDSAFSWTARLKGADQHQTIEFSSSIVPSDRYLDHCGV